MDVLSMWNPRGGQCRKDLRGRADVPGSARTAVVEGDSWYMPNQSTLEALEDVPSNVSIVRLQRRRMWRATRL